MYMMHLFLFCCLSVISVRQTLIIEKLLMVYNCYNDVITRIFAIELTCDSFQLLVRASGVCLHSHSRQPLITGTGLCFTSYNMLMPLAMTFMSYYTSIICITLEIQSHSFLNQQEC